MDFFPEKGRKSSIVEKYDVPVLRVPELQEGKAATFEFNKALCEELELTPENYLVFAVQDGQLYAKVAESIPENTRPRMLSVSKTTSKSTLGSIRKASSKPVAEWIFNSTSITEGAELFFVQEQGVYRLTTEQPLTEREEAQMYDRAEEFINQENYTV